MIAYRMYWGEQWRAYHGNLPEEIFGPLLAGRKQP